MVSTVNVSSSVDPSWRPWATGEWVLAHFPRESKLQINIEEEMYNMTFPGILFIPLPPPCFLYHFGVTLVPLCHDYLLTFSLLN